MANNKRRCRYCKEYKVAAFMKIIHGAAYCNIDCATKYAYENKNKGRKIKHAEQKRDHKVNDKAFRMKQAQKAFNAFVRERDKNECCISCDKTKDWQGQWHAGHFYTTKARPDIRFNEDNCHKQCSVCNNFLSGNIGEYRPKLINKIGTDRFLSLSLNKVRRYTCEELLDIEKDYKVKLKNLAQGVTT